MECDPLKRHQKRMIRRRTIAAIHDLSPEDRRQQEAHLIARFATLPGAADATCILLYVSAFPEEVDTSPLIEAALIREQRVVCPRVDRLERRLRLFQIDVPETDFEPGILGIPEPRAHCREVSPSEIDWALIPGVGFDDRCERLGRGGGHYDRLIPRLRPNVPRWALALDCQLVDALPVEAHDMPLDGVAMATQTYRRGGPPA